MVRCRVRVAVIVAALAAGGLAAAPPAVGNADLVAGVVGPADPAGSVPEPDDDPFYDVPDGIDGLPNGAVLRSRRITATALSVPLPVDAWQVLYKTLDSHDQPTATVMTLMVPVVPWLDSGPRPLLSYQTAEDGVGTRCAPSYALRAGLAAGPTNSNLESLLISNALVRGWAVVAPDYEGPDSQFLAAPMEAHGVLDGIRAARRFAPGGIAPNAPIGMWGYSGGAFATSVAAQAQPTYAPGLDIAGVALGGVPADIKSALDAFNGSAAGGAIVLGVIGLDRAYPEVRLESLLTPEGRQKLAASQEDCINDAIARHPFLRIEDYEAVPDALELPRVRRLLADNSPLTFPGTPSAPVYGYHSVFDELAPIGSARRLYERYCAAGVPVQLYEDLLSEHAVLAATGAPAAMSYLADRFARRPAPSTC